MKFLRRQNSWKALLLVSATVIIGCGDGGPTVQQPDAELRELYEQDAKPADKAMENQSLEKIPTG